MCVCQCFKYVHTHTPRVFKGGLRGAPPLKMVLPPLSQLYFSSNLRPPLFLEILVYPPEFFF